jgi:signal transduction histidine kinase
MRGRQLAVVLAGLALGVASLGVAREDPAGSLGGDSIAASLALAGAGWALVITGAVAWARRPSSRFGILLAAVGFAWFLVPLDNPGAGSGVAFTVGLVSYAACPPLVAHAALAYPGGRLASPLERIALIVAYGATVLLLGLAAALVFDPVAQGCSQCPANHLAVTSDPGLLAALQRDGVWLGLAWAVALAGIAAWHVARSSSAARLVTAPVLLAAVVYLVLVAADYAHSVDRGFLSNDDIEKRLWAGQAAALVALALGVVLAWVRGRRARAEVARLVVELGEAPAPGGLRDALARALADPDLELAYPLGEGRQVDAAGQAIELPQGNGRAVTPLVRGGRPVAVLGHRAALVDDPGLLEEVGTAARLALDHERLEAELRAQLEALRASRARAVETGDAERRRLERDLHDGAQQRLVVLSLGLRLLGDQLGPSATGRVDTAEAELHGALEDLRELGRGIYPAVLVDEGLAAALDSLAEEGLTPIVVGPMPSERLAPAVEAAAYFLVAEVLKRSRARGLAVSAELSDGRLVVEIAATGTLDDDLTDLEDRLGALDGELTVERSADDRLAVRAEVPCGS